MKDGEIDKILELAAQARPDLEPALLERAAGSIKPPLRPVRPLPPRWVQTSGLILMAAAVALAGAARAGFYGIEKLSRLEWALILPALGVLLSAAAAVFVGEMNPGSRRRIAPGALLGIASLALIGLFLALFRDFRTDHFVSTGMTCLVTGLIHAVPAGLAGWWLLRRGFAVNSVAAGLAGGMLGGLAGVIMLELHCPNFEVPHLLLWHTAVVPVGGALGAFLAWSLRFRTAFDPREPVVSR